ncbi:GL12957 [Drosophila persimilis]|uniref:GL12957 n=1 Tax=Drosophila persimilis TaxID=7234 RepID=B4GUU6_DROPE|nr:GL12957 [Drosophila persimilis]
MLAVGCGLWDVERSGGTCKVLSPGHVAARGTWDIRPVARPRPPATVVACSAVISATWQLYTRVPEEMSETRSRVSVFAAAWVQPRPLYVPLIMMQQQQYRQHQRKRQGTA